MISRLVHHGFLGLLLTALVTCARPFTVSVNDQAVYDPTGRIGRDSVVNADLQGCINIALRQQQVTSPDELTVLSCADSKIDSLENIAVLRQLRFLDLGNNLISNITPLEGMSELGGLNLANNRIYDIRPLLLLPGLAAVSLTGNDNIPCEQLRQLRARLGNNLTSPDSCIP